MTIPAYINVRDFGAKGDGVTDDTRAFQDAIRAYRLKTIREEYSTSPKIIVPVSDKPYRITSDLIVDNAVIIEGMGPNARGLGSPELVFDDTCRAGIWIKNSGTPGEPDGWGGQGTIIRNLSLTPKNNGGVDYGIIHNTAVTLEGVTCGTTLRGFRLAGFFAHAQGSGDEDYGEPTSLNGWGTMVGNVNGSLYSYCHARHTSEGHGFACQGNVAGIIFYQNCDSQGNRGCGFRLAASIGCHLIGCHTAQNTIKTEHNGTIYMCIYPHTSSARTEPGVGSDWERYWVPVRATISDQTWQDGVDYREAGGVNVVFPTTHTIFSHYSEGGIEYGIIPRGATNIFGGSAVRGRIFYGPDSQGTSAYGCGESNTPTEWRHTEGGYEFGSSMGRKGAYTAFETGHTHDPEATTGANNGFKISYSTIRNAYELCKRALPLVSFTTKNWKKDGHSGVNVFFNEGLIIGGFKTSKVTAEYNYDLIPKNRHFVRGDIVIFTAEPGFALGVVTRAGSKADGLEMRGIAHGPVLGAKPA